jgi:hypothetical protein
MFRGNFIATLPPMCGGGIAEPTVLAQHKGIKIGKVQKPICRASPYYPITRLLKMRYLLNGNGKTEDIK